MLRKRLVKIFLALILVALPAAAWAADIQSGNSISINETRKDLYLFGQNAYVNSPIQGDLAVFAADTSVEKGVGDSAMIFAGTARVKDKIGRHVRAFAGNVNLEAGVGGDAILFGSIVTTTDKSIIGGDLIAGGNQVSINGQVGGKSKIYANSATLNGRFANDVELHGSTLNITKDTEIKGTLTYYAPKEATVAEGAKLNKVEWHKTEAAARGIRTLKNMAGWTSLVISLVSLAVLAIIILYLIPTFIDTTVREATRTPLKNFWLGLAFAIVTPIVALLLLASILGMSLASGVISAYATIILVAQAVAAIYTGAFVLKLVRARKAEANWKAALLGTLIFVLLGFIPVVGWIVKAAIYLIALGAIVAQLFLLGQNLKNKKLLKAL